MGWKRKRLEAMGDEDVNDVHLVGTDGKEVPCCKAFLATMSPVFKAMFFRGFKEQKTDRCSLDFHSLVITLIVQYCYCGEVDMDLIFSKKKSIGEEAILLVELREAGRYFEIEGLSTIAEARIGNLVFQKNNDEKKYQYASAFLTELFKRDENKEPLALAIFQFAVRNTMKCFCPRASENIISTDTIHPHPSVLSNVLQENEDTYAVVKCMQTLFRLESKGDEHGYNSEEKLVLIEIAKNIDLRRLSTKQLSNIKPCSLFSSERILDAFVHHCKCQEMIAEALRIELGMYISGARMDYLNGFYEQIKYEGNAINIFHKQVEHNGVSCRSIIHPRHTENKWMISITKDTRVLAQGIERTKTEAQEQGPEVYENCIQAHVYESSCEDRKVPPFNSWKCTEGTCQAPIVACIYHQESD